MNVIDSEKILQNLGYNYIKKIEPAIQPNRTNIKFKDIVFEFENKDIALANEYLYEHQLIVLDMLKQGHNIILKAGTGSGKTESWYFYFHDKARKENFKAIAVYPTLALANDQIKRISFYASLANIFVTKIDALLRDEIVKQIGLTGLRKQLSSAKLVITNPAFLLNEIKKFLISPRNCVFDFRKINLIIIDEFDFYSPRSIALLLAMIKMLTDFSDEKPQIVILTATLANPEDMCKYLEDVTNRKCSIVDGKPFKVENRMYIVLGKNLENIWNNIKIYYDSIVKKDNVDKDIVEALNNFEIFKKNVYRVLQYLEALGYEIPSISIDLKEILKNYANEDSVTLVFTKSIARANEIARNLKEIAGNSVAVHHHLIPKKIREDIEEKARKREVKIVISPRTLMQGIDIGTITRIIHIGLPENVKVFIQREGRKGRRKDVLFSESIIIPFSRWDWELLSKGFDSFEKWLNLPLEKTIVNPKNKYIYLFTSLAKILSPWYKKSISKEEHEVLKSIKIVRKNGSIDIDKVKRVWNKLNFYEFGPPYGIKRYLEYTEDQLIPLEPIGHCDFVERFQKGCLDLSQDAIVKRIEIGRSSRIARAVIESKLSKFNFYSDDAIAEAFEEYKYSKFLWREEVNIFKDIMRGKLHSYVLTVVYPPRKGFGEYVKIPNRVLWHLTSSKPLIAKIGEKHIVTYNRKIIHIPVETAGIYRDYTYGFVIEVDEKEDTMLLRLGLAYLMIILRKLYGIPLETIMYSVNKIGEKKFFEIHEPESAGLIENLEWNKIKKDIEMYKPDDLDLVLLLQLDDIAYSDLLSMGLDLNVVKNIVLKIIDYLMLREKIAAIFKGNKIVIPRPSKILKIVTVDSFKQIVSEDEIIRRAIIGLGFYDGENVKSIVDLYIMYPFTPPPKTLREFEVEIEDMVLYNNIKLVVFDKELIAKEFESVGLKRLAKTINNYGCSLREILIDIGLNPVSLNTIASELKVENIDISLEVVDITELHKLYTSAVENMTVNGISQKIMSFIKKYLETRSKLLYLIYLVSQVLQQSSNSVN